MTHEPLRYQKQIVVEADHLDQLSHVNNIVYLKWVQEISEEHWRAQTSDEIQEQYIWMVLDHHIQYKKQAKLNDEIMAVTFVHDMSGVRSTRHVEFSRGEELLAKCESQWCMLDAKSLRPKRIPEEVTNLFRT